MRKRTRVLVFLFVVIGLSIIPPLLFHRPTYAQTPVTGASSTNPPTGTGATQTQGTVAAGSAAANNPVLIGYRDTSGNTQYLAGGNVGGGLGINIGQLSVAADGVSNASFGAGPNNAASALLTGQYLFNGATWDRQFYCPNTATFSVVSTITQVVALSGTTKVRICSVSLNPSTITAGSVDLVYGTGTNCGTGTTTLTGAFTLPASAVVNIPVPLTVQGPLITPAAQAVCVRTVTSTVNGFITWAQF